MVKNGVEYSEYELDILKEYIEEIETEVNKYLLSGEIPVTIKNTTQMKDFLNKIEILYGIACKYGVSHDIPEKNENDNKSTQIPFINFNDLFNENLVSDEKNIFVLPNQQYENNNSETSIYLNNDVSDAEFRLIVEYNNNQGLTKSEQEAFEKLTKKLQNYTMARFKKIQKVYMEKALVIGNNVTKFCVDKYPGLMKEEPNLERIITLEEIKSNISSDKNSTIGWGVPSLLEEEYTRRPSYEKTSKYKVLKSRCIDIEIIQKVLNFGHKIGNYEFTKKLAEKGLLIDEASETEIKDLPEDGEEKKEIEETAILEVQSSTELVVYKESWFKKLFRIIKAQFNEEI